MAAWKPHPAAPPGGTFQGWKRVADFCPRCRQQKVHWRMIDGIDNYWCIACRHGWKERILRPPHGRMKSDHD